MVALCLSLWTFRVIVTGQERHRGTLLHARRNSNPREIGNLDEAVRWYIDDRVGPLKYLGGLECGTIATEQDEPSAIVQHLFFVASLLTVQPTQAGTMGAA